MNLLEKAISIVSPSWALMRMRRRVATATLDKSLKRSFDAASSGRRTKGWRKVIGSANAETQGAAAILRDRARDAVQNNAWAARAMAVITSNVVGWGILAQAKGSRGGDRRARLAMKLWQAWAGTPACDFEGVHDFAGIQALVMTTVARDGMCLVRRRRMPGEPVPIKLQVLESDFLDTSRVSGEDGRRVIQGVEVDTDGRVTGYWLFQRHPGDVGWWGSPSFRNGLVSVRVPADDILRVYRQDRAGQLTGISWLAPVMVPLRDLDDYEDAQIIRQKIAACFAVFIRDAVENEDGLDVSDTTEHIEPGAVQTLPPGKDVTFANPPGVGDFDNFTRTVLRKVAAGIGITYEAMTGDYSQVNFSSGRMGWIEMGRNVDAWRWRMLIPMLCQPIWDWFVEAATLGGNSVSGVAATWTPPRRELINPKAEIDGMIAEVRSGFTSWPEAVRERGYDPDALLAEIAENNKRLDDLGIILDCDPRRTGAQGQPVSNAVAEPQ